MKTMKLGDLIKRVKEKDALTLEKNGWLYTTKKEWKTKVRDINNETEIKKEKKK